MIKVSKVVDTKNDAGQVASFYKTADNKFLWVSAVNNQYTHETMVFDAEDASGDTIDFAGLICLGGVFDHAQALAELGYEVS